MHDAPADLTPVGALVGTSVAIERTRELVLRLGPTNLSVLVRGPTGVGKELVAEALHRASGRAGPLVRVNVCAIPDSMFESALFGHVRGAFTGALNDHAGFVTEAHRGTLFLDEIGDLALPLQAKLLRVLETRVYRKVGGRHDESSDFRLVVATNADLRTAVADGRFRADLAYRLGAAVIEVAPLRQRLEDVPYLAAHFARCADDRARAVAPEGIRLLQAHEWPGNVRELRHVIDYAAALADDGSITANALATALSQIARLADLPGPSVAREINESRDELVAVLDRCGWHVPSAAATLRVTKKTIYARIQRFGIEIPDRYHRREPPVAAERGLRLL